MLKLVHFLVSLATLAIVALILLSGCAATPTPAPGCDDGMLIPSESWDQGNLKLHDSGCPSSIFIAPNGNLVQCDT